MVAAFGILRHLHRPAHEDMEVNNHKPQILYFLSYISSINNNQVELNIFPFRNVDFEFNPLQSFIDLPRQIGAQGQTHGQAAVTVDGPHPPGHADLPGDLDTLGYAHGGGDRGQRGPQVQAVRVQLVGSQLGHR